MHSYRKLTRSALLCALSVVLMYFSAIAPAGRLGLAAAAGLTSAVALMSCGFAWGAGVFAVSAILSFLLLPVKGCAVIYAAFFGYYPLLKSRLERMHSIGLEWFAKLCIFNLAVTGMLLLARELIITGFVLDEIWEWLFVYAVLNAAFVAYDIAMTKAIEYYIFRISKNMDGRKQ